ncbi:MAG: hypothetical protein ACE5H0_04600 [Bacteroidota bacterium]
MRISEQTRRFVQELDEYSSRRLKNQEELAQIIELAQTQRKQQVLDDIAFFAKSLWNTFNVMQRTGPAGEGYDKLSILFNENYEKVSTLIRTLVKEAPEDVKDHFKVKFFSLTHEGMSQMMNLIHDVSWLKNWGIDHKKTL